MDIRGESVMFARGVCISTFRSFQNQCHVNTSMLGATSVCLVLNIFRKTLHVEGNKIPVSAMSRTNIDYVTSFSCKKNKKLQGASWVAVQQALTYWPSLLPY